MYSVSLRYNQVGNMYIQQINTKQNGKIYPSLVLCESYRKNGKPKRRVLATITKWPKHIIDGLRILLKGGTISCLDDLQSAQGKSFGALWVLFQIAKRIGLVSALGNSKNAKLALLQIIARCISPSSRLHISNYWPQHYAIEEVLKIKESFDEYDLYNNLDWLNNNQQRIEKKLFVSKHNEAKIKEIYLYDVTSSYFEGDKNELSEFGYNRDKKKGKKQIVIGLLCDLDGDPISVEVFKGNTSDLSTFSSQLQKLKEEYGVEQVVMVGDKGMIKTKQIDQINQMGWNYITSITKAQIETLLKLGAIQMEMFEDEPIEVEMEDGLRYILRRNAYRADLIQNNRNEKLKYIAMYVSQQNTYLEEHLRAKTEKAVERIEKKIKKFKLQSLITITGEDRKIRMTIEEEIKVEKELLDGCYVIKTELTKDQISATQAHKRYKELSKVEHAFRTMKTGIEHLRPIFLRNAGRTRGHVFVCMLAYKILHRMRTQIDKIDQFPTMKEMIKSLEAIHYSSYKYENQPIKMLPSKYNPTQEKILEKLKIKMPNKL